MDTDTSQGTPIVTNTLLRNWEGKRIDHRKTAWSSWHNLCISTSTSRPMRKANSAAVLSYTLFKTITKLLQHATGLKTLYKPKKEMWGRHIWSAFPSSWSWDAANWSWPRAPVNKSKIKKAMFSVFWITALSRSGLTDFTFKNHILLVLWLAKTLLHMQG